ncbi:MAG TPA: TolC family protein [Acidobacteriaceae bacterium]|nr:TolC family protein [Acidobacteriaceae bacterium]
MTVVHPVLRSILTVSRVLTLFCFSSLPCWGQQLSLHDAIAQALSSPQARAAAARTDEARAGVRQAGLGPNPRLFLQSEDWRPWGNGFDFPTQTEDYAFVSQTFEVDGKRHKRMALADAQLGQARAHEQMVRFTIVGRVAGAYWNAAVLAQTASLLEADMQAVDEMVRYHKERVDAGAMRGVDLLRMRIERDRLEMTLRATERDAAQARLELFRQMGRSAIAEVRLSDPVEALVRVAPMPVETVLARRADVEEARQAVVAAESDVKLQKANGVPDPDLIGGYKRNSATNTGYGSLQIPLPFRNRNQGEIQRAEASVRLAQDNLQAMDVQVRAEIAEAEENYRREQEIVDKVLPDMRARAKENLQLMTEAYRIGGVDLLRYLDAERTEFEVEVTAFRTFADLQQAALRLQLSYGVQP